MQPKTLKLFVTATMMIACITLTLGLLFLGFFFGSPEKPLIHTTSSDGGKLELGSGMGPNLMTPKSDNSTDDLIDMINTEFKDEWVAGQTSITRRYMSALIAGEGCKSYVDYGDGNWVPTNDDTSNPIKLDVGGDPFGDGGSDSNPFE